MVDSESTKFYGGNMSKKTTAIIVTIAALLLCGCPGLFSLFTGGLFALISFMPGADINMMGSSDPKSALMFGIGGVVVGILFLLVAAAAIFISWRRKNSPASEPNP
jgi:hypothetical protein